MIAIAYCKSASTVREKGIDTDTSATELGTVPADLIGAFSLIFYSTPQEAVFKALGVE